jgi:hypothetical protein
MRIKNSGAISSTLKVCEIRNEVFKKIPPPPDSIAAIEYSEFVLEFAVNFKNF